MAVMMPIRLDQFLTTGADVVISVDSISRSGGVSRGHAESGIGRLAMVV